MATVPLALLLLRASRWFDRQLLDGLERAGWPALSPAQSLVFAHLDPDGTTPAELARRLGNSRQATQDLLAGLVKLDLVLLQSNPARRGGRLVVLSESGRRLTTDAQHLLATLESELGTALVDQLRASLEALDRLGSAVPGPERPWSRPPAAGG